jgi:uncharacterized protein
MKTFDEIKELIGQSREDLRLQYGVKEIGIFGSFVKGTQKVGSDLDILIEFEKPIGFVRFMRLESRLSELFEVRVELVTKNALKPHIGRRILQEVIYV